MLVLIKNKILIENKQISSECLNRWKSIHVNTSIDLLTYLLAFFFFFKQGNIDSFTHNSCKTVTLYSSFFQI